MRSKFGNGQWCYDVFLPVTPKSGQGSNKNRYIRLVREVLPTNELSKRRPFEYQVSVDATFHFYGKSPCDIDNLFKLLLDAIKTIVIKDDKLIKEIYGKIEENSPIEGVHLKIKKYTNKKALFLRGIEEEKDEEMTKFNG